MHSWLLKQLRNLGISILLGCYSISAFAWTALGHELIAQIAYNHLNPKAKDRVDYLVHYMDNQVGHSDTFMSAATWADDIKSDDVHAFDQWHFINLSFSPDKTPLPPVDKQNVVWAINQSQNVLESNDAKDYEKAIFLRFFIHFVGDIHQPLHCATRFTKEFVKGDVGGNLFLIQSPDGQNLHQLWDRILGAYPTSSFTQSTNEQKQTLLKEWAKQIETQFPLDKYDFSAEETLLPMTWAQESFAIATTYAYQVPEGGIPSTKYLEEGRTLAKERIALAGYRLAHILNDIFD